MAERRVDAQRERREAHAASVRKADAAMRADLQRLRLEAKKGHQASDRTHAKQLPRQNSNGKKNKGGRSRQCRSCKQMLVSDAFTKSQRRTDEPQCRVCAKSPLGEADTLERLIAQASDLFVKGRWADATRVYSAALKLIPNLATLRTARAAALIMQRLYSRALDDCREALLIDQGNVKAMLQAAFAERELGNFVKAERFLYRAERATAVRDGHSSDTKLAQIAEHDMRILDALKETLTGAHSLRRERRYEEALSWIQARSGPAERCESLRFERVELLLLAAPHKCSVAGFLGHVTEARDLIAELRADADVLRHLPAKRDLLFLLEAVCEFYLDRARGDLACVNHDVRLAAERAAAHKSAGREQILWWRDRVHDIHTAVQHADRDRTWASLPECLGDMDAFFVQCPRWARMTVSIANSALSVRLFVAADQFCRLALRLDSAAPVGPTFAKLSAQFVLVDDAKALLYADMALHCNPSLMVALATRARIHLRQRRFSEAVADFARLKEREPESYESEWRAAKQALEASTPTDHYTVLDVPRTATAAEVKRRYKQLALKYHPDKHPEGEQRAHATVMFIKISNAHAVLSDPIKRREYDASARSDSNRSPASFDPRTYWRTPSDPPRAGRSDPFGFGFNPFTAGGWDGFGFDDVDDTSSAEGGGWTGYQFVHEDDGERDANEHGHDGDDGQGVYSEE